MNIILITYLSRSGSTLLSSLLSRYKKILVFPEAEILVTHILKSKKKITPSQKLFRYLESDKKFREWDIDLSEIDFLDTSNNIEVFLKILEQYRRKTKPDATIIVFKAFELINCYHLFHNNKSIKIKPHFIALIRDPRAIFASQQESISELTKQPINTNPLITSTNWRKLIDFCKTQLGNSDFSITKYENLFTL